MPKSPEPPQPLLEVVELQTTFSLRGSLRQRAIGRASAVIRAIDDVSFDLRKGEVLGVVGESGSGKSTLARTLLGLIRPTGGSIRFEGQELVGLNESRMRVLRERMQIVFQDPHASLNPAMTIADSVGHPLKFHKRAGSNRELRVRVAESLERVGLAPASQFMNKYPRDLSGGQKQRAVIARAIILKPVLLIADEPVSMLDMSVRAKILDLMVELKRELDLTYIYITHDLATAKFFCDRIAIMYLGRIVELAEAGIIYTKPRHPYTEALYEQSQLSMPSARYREICPMAKFQTPPPFHSAADSTRVVHVPLRFAAGSCATFANCWSAVGRSYRTTTPQRRFRSLARRRGRPFLARRYG